jgi:uncharacterized glyoxalase superfamily protein PhnB
VTPERCRPRRHRSISRRQSSSASKGRPDACTRPVPRLRDATTSLRFLTEALGFDLVIDQRDTAGHLIHAELRHGDAVIMGGPGNTSPATSPGLYLVVEDVDTIYDAAIGAGATSLYPPENTTWGSRRARITDPDGHEWSFGTYKPGS